jgi:ferrous iron transport protein A
MSVAEILDLPEPEPEASPRQGGVALSVLRRGAKGLITQVGVGEDGAHLPADAELERRLLELGFVEGARLEILHEGLFGRDPLVIRLDERRVALRRREAQRVLVRLEPDR